MDVKLEQIDDFKEQFNKYYKLLMNYIQNYKLNETNKFASQELIDLAIELEYKFYCLDKRIIERLLDLQFEVFIHCNNEIDFYSFGIFITKGNRFQDLVTIAVRVEAELDLIEKFIKNNNWKCYENTIKRRHDFYREYKIDVLDTNDKENADFWKSNELITRNKNLRLSEFVTLACNDILKEEI